MSEYMTVAETMRAHAAKDIAALKEDDNEFRAMHAYDKARRAERYAASEDMHDDITATAIEHGWIAVQGLYDWTFTRNGTVLQWWPARGKTMFNRRQAGPTCGTPNRIIALLAGRLR